MQRRVAIYEAYSNSFYGNSRYILALVKGFSSSNWQPVLIEPHSGELRSRVDAAGGEAIRVEPPRILQNFGGALLRSDWSRKALVAIAIARHTVRLAGILRKLRIDILQCHNVRSTLTAGWAAKLLGIPVLLYVKGDLEDERLAKIAFRLADRILFQSNLNMENCPDSIRCLFDSKIAIVENAVDLTELEEARDRGAASDFYAESRSGDKTRLAFLGTLCPRKGIDVLLKATAKLTSRGIAFQLYIVGDHGVDEYIEFADQMKQLHRDLGLEGRVIFLGWRKDAHEILSCVDIFVLPARSEGVPKSILEAMALGKPVIATDVGGVRSIVQDNVTGIVTESEDVDELADAMQTLCDDPELARSMGEKGKHEIYQHHSLSAHLEKISGVYKDLLAPRR